MQSRNIAECGKNSDGETEGCASGETLQRGSNVQHQVTYRDYLLQSPARHHEAALPGVQSTEDRAHR